MARNYVDYVRSAFSPLVEASGDSSIANDLKTRDLPKERQKPQFRRFRELEVSLSCATPIANGGFIAVLKEQAREIILVCAPTLNTSEKEELAEECRSKYNFQEIKFDEATFLIAVHELQGFLKIKDEFRHKERARDFLGIVDAEYKGHEIYDLMDTYKEVAAFELSPDNPLTGADISHIALKIAALSPQIRSPILTQELSDAIITLEGRVGCSSDNLQQAINAAQWRHAFLDVYRCLESLFFFPWVKQLHENAAPGVSIGLLPVQWTAS